MIRRSKELKHALLKHLLSSVECRLSIAKVDKLPVSSRYALVRLTELDAWEVGFTSDLTLPAHRNITVSLEMIMKHRDKECSIFSNTNPSDSAEGHPAGRNILWAFCRQGNKRHRSVRTR